MVREAGSKDSLVERISFAVNRNGNIINNNSNNNKNIILKTIIK